MYIYIYICVLLAARKCLTICLLQGRGFREATSAGCITGIVSTEYFSLCGPPASSLVSVYGQFSHVQSTKC